MNLVAVETSTEFCSLAVARGDDVFESSFHAGQMHSELALPGLSRLMSQAKLSMDAITGIVFGCGPGSFTGLRIACGIAQGLALARDLPVVGVPTLLALAEDSGAQAVIACLDARMGEVYHAAYRRSADEWQEVHAPGVYSPQNVPDADSGKWRGCGSGFKVFRAQLQARYAGLLEGIDADAVPSAAAMLRLARAKFQRGEAGNAASATPLYVRNKVAFKVSER